MLLLTLLVACHAVVPRPLAATPADRPWVPGFLARAAAWVQEPGPARHGSAGRKPSVVEESGGHRAKLVTDSGHEAAHWEHQPAELHSDLPPSKEARGYAWCLVGAVAFDMSLFYLVNFHDPDIRTGTWKTLNMTVSIFCAVLIYGSIRAVLMDLLEPTRGEMIGLNLWLLAVLYVVMQVVLFYLKDVADETLLASGGTLFAHIAGFAAMFGFAGLQMVTPFKGGLFGAASVVVLAGVVIVVLTMAASKIREGVAKADGVIDRFEERWEEQVEETENDVLSLCLGFTIMQVVRFAIAGKLPPPEPEEPPKSIEQWHADALLASSAVFAAFTFLGTWLVDRQLRQKTEGSAIARRYAKAMQNVSSMTMACCLLAWGEWQVYTLGFEGVRVAGCMLVALGLTALCLGLIFVLAFVSERFAKVGSTGRKSLRSLELALGFVVGRAWEVAFDIAFEEISRGLSFGLGHGVARQVGKHLLPLSLLIVVLPAWHKYILPRSLEH